MTNNTLANLTNISYILLGSLLEMYVILHAIFQTLETDETTKD